MHRLGLLALLLCRALMVDFDARATDPGTVSVLTFNIRTSSADDGPNDWRRRKEQVVALLRRVAADFVGVQEACPDQVSYLREQLTEYQALARSRRADPAHDEAVPLLYRQERWQLDPQESGTFWLSATPEEPGSMSFGNELPRIVTWGRFVEKASGRALYVWNTHFDHRSEPARVRSARLLARRIAERPHREPVVVLGDFNSSDAGTALRYLTGQLPDSPLALIDTFTARYPEAKEDSGTFHGFTGQRTRTKIDFVLALPPVEVLETEILHGEQEGRYPSDHFPLLARLRFPVSVGN